MAMQHVSNWDLAGGELPPVLQARCRTAIGGECPALCVAISETDCVLFVAATTLECGERLFVECGGTTHAGIVSSVEERLVRLSFEWPLARTEMRRFLKGERPRWECDFGPN